MAVGGVVLTIRENNFPKEIFDQSKDFLGENYSLRTSSKFKKALSGGELFTRGVKLGEAIAGLLGSSLFVVGGGSYVSMVRKWMSPALLVAKGLRYSLCPDMTSDDWWLITVCKVTCPIFLLATGINGYAHLGSKVLGMKFTTATLNTWKSIDGVLSYGSHSAFMLMFLWGIKNLYTVATYKRYHAEDAQFDKEMQARYTAAHMQLLDSVKYGGEIFESLVPEECQLAISLIPRTAAVLKSGKDVIGTWLIQDPAKAKSKPGSPV